MDNKEEKPVHWSETEYGKDLLLSIARRGFLSGADVEITENLGDLMLRECPKCGLLGGGCGCEDGFKR